VRELDSLPLDHSLIACSFRSHLSRALGRLVRLLAFSLRLNAFNSADEGRVREHLTSASLEEDGAFVVLPQLEWETTVGLTPSGPKRGKVRFSALHHILLMSRSLSCLLHAAQQACGRFLHIARVYYMSMYVPMRSGVQDVTIGPAIDVGPPKSPLRSCKRPSPAMAYCYFVLRLMS
jgi:hypothetical protein